MRVFVHSRMCVNVRVRVRVYVRPRRDSGCDCISPPYLSPPSPPAPLQSGGFYSAEDADSSAVEGADQKKEGAFCVHVEAG